MERTPFHFVENNSELEYKVNFLFLLLCTIIIQETVIFLVYTNSLDVQKYSFWQQELTHKLYSQYEWMRNFSWAHKSFALKAASKQICGS